MAPALKKKLRFQVPCEPCPLPMKQSRRIAESIVKTESPAKAVKSKNAQKTDLAKPMKTHGRFVKSCKPGVYTRNPFFNFLREFRKMNCGLKVTEVAKRGAIEWHKLSAERKISFYKRSRKVPLLNKYCRC